MSASFPRCSGIVRALCLGLCWTVIAASAAAQDTVVTQTVLSTCPALQLDAQESVPAGTGLAVSPDGRWLAYSSTDSGREEVYVTHFPSGEGRWQVSQTGGTFPAWRADSKEIWFVGTDGSLHAASVDTKSEEFELAPVRTLFQVSYIAPVGNPYDVTPDGQRVVFSTLPESVATPLVLVTNWTADLKR